MLNGAGPVSTDSRPPLARLRRCQLWQLADKVGLQYPAGAPSTLMVQLLGAAAVDPRQHFHYEAVHGRDENGNPTVEHYPVIKNHHTADKNLDYDTIIASNIQGTDDQHEDKFDQSKVEARDRRIEQLEKQLAALADKLGEDDESKPLDLPFKLTLGQKKQLLKSRGIDPRGMTRQEVDAALET